MQKGAILASLIVLVLEPALFSYAPYRHFYANIRCFALILGVFGADSYLAKIALVL